MTTITPPAYLKRIVLSLLFLSFCMILLGGVVKNTGSSLACPDWPLCFGKIMPEMKGGVAIEHSHRLLGTLLGILSALVLLGAKKIRKEYPVLFKASLISFFLVVFQGLLGGATVLFQISAKISLIHLVTSHLFFASLVFLYIELTDCAPHKGIVPPTDKLIKGIKITGLLLLAQITLGAFVRHFGHGGACGLGWASSVQCLDAVSGLKTYWPTQAGGKWNMLHRFLGILVAFQIIKGTLPLIKWAKIQKLRSLRVACILCHAAVTVQVLLGMKVIGTGIANLAITLHLAFALILWSLLCGIYFRLKKMQKLL